MEPGCGSLTLVGRVGRVVAAFGVFNWLEVLDLDLFFCFLSFFLFLVLHVV
jgi:hypothetical protein